MSHVILVESDVKGDGTTWLEPVDDDLYQSANNEVVQVPALRKPDHCATPPTTYVTLGLHSRAAAGARRRSVGRGRRGPWSARR
jgi:hypothetical protein